MKRKPRREVQNNKLDPKSWRTCKLMPVMFAPLEPIGYHSKPDNVLDTKQEIPNDKALCDTFENNQQIDDHFVDVNKMPL